MDWAGEILEIPLNRIDLQHLTDERILDAEALLNAGRWSGAYYMAGYAAECALKACTARKTQLHDFPDKVIALRVYTHDLEDLLDAAGLKLQLKLDTTTAVNPNLRFNWQVVKDWDVTSRYQTWSEAKARQLYQAVTEIPNGVLPWVKSRW